MQDFIVYKDTEGKKFKKEKSPAYVDSKLI